MCAYCFSFPRSHSSVYGTSLAIQEYEPINSRLDPGHLATIFRHSTASGAEHPSGKKGSKKSSARTSPRSDTRNIDGSDAPCEFGMDAFWVVDFPLFCRAEPKEEVHSGAQITETLLESSHHPFTAPKLEHLPRFRAAIQKSKGKCFE